jgi:hypothetical protein
VVWDIEVNIVGEPVADAMKQLHAHVRLVPTIVPLGKQRVSICIRQLFNVECVL